MSLALPCLVCVYVITCGRPSAIGDDLTGNLQPDSSAGGLSGGNLKREFLHFFPRNSFFCNSAAAHANIDAKMHFHFLLMRAIRIQNETKSKVCLEEEKSGLANRKLSRSIVFDGVPLSVSVAKSASLSLAINGEAEFKLVDLVAWIDFHCELRQYGAAHEVIAM